MSSAYESPFKSRYSSKEMQYLFSSDMKFRTWRKLWIALAESEKQLGLAITDEQISQMKKFRDDINYEAAESKEKEVKHDVMAHVFAFGEQCPQARGIIHLGATSCFVGDNADLIIMREALHLVQGKILAVIRNLSEFALKYRSMPTLGYTHFQPAQLVTVGKRACIWINDLKTDFDDLNYISDSIKLLGNKGTTGTQASFLELFDGDHDKVKRLDALIASKMGFTGTVSVSGQTYSRKHDSRILNVLSGIAQSAHKFGNDLRLLQGLKEIEEPFGKEQIGSSAMAYKRNPMKCERICSLARYVITDALNPAVTASAQWLERTLDDSANRRISISEGFLAVDAILNLYIAVSSGMTVYPKIIEKHVYEELPFMATENILMEAVKRGGDRQALHERIRVHSMEASHRIKVEGQNNDLLARISNDKAFGFSSGELDKIIDPADYTGRAPEQVEEYIQNEIDPLIKSFSQDLPEIKIDY
ncbi:MAG: adenylosuccinate lyase [Eubacteriales bacterium]|nr:adenylosuccinate lyase [Eubacteriales bacterium]